ncbi:hypothetical protein M0N77_06475 [Psychrobacter sp. AH5]|uniref:hypothetical protein n=1 Tax=Psychrobacter sp. AH5 TaxID=2937433 RepID=UPI00333E2982
MKPNLSITSASQSIKSYLGYSRHDCTQLLANKNIDSIAFAHWLAIPSQQLLLVFRHQHCVAVDCYSLAA